MNSKHHKIQEISSRENPLVKRLRRLAQDAGVYRRLGQVWLEGEHLCSAAYQAGVRPSIVVLSADFLSNAPRPWLESAAQVVSLPATLFAQISGLGSPAKIAYVIEIPDQTEIESGLPSLVLDRVQDAGNVGSMLRSASAFGFKQVIALKGTAALWSPKVLRAGMGAHFGLRLVESANLDDVAALKLPLLASSPHRGEFLHQASSLPWPCAWIMGHEGQGVSADLSALATHWLRIAQPGGEESLNVSAAAAICMHASAVSQHQHR